MSDIFEFVSADSIPEDGRKHSGGQRYISDIVYGFIGSGQEAARIKWDGITNDYGKPVKKSSLQNSIRAFIRKNDLSDEISLVVRGNDLYLVHN